jgi:hypothetical protein
LQIVDTAAVGGLESSTVSSLSNTCAGRRSDAARPCARLLAAGHARAAQAGCRRLARGRERADLLRYSSKAGPAPSKRVVREAEKRCGAALDGPASAATEWPSRVDVGADPGRYRCAAVLGEAWRAWGAMRDDGHCPWEVVGWMLCGQ